MHGHVLLAKRVGSGHAGIFSVLLRLIQEYRVLLTIWDWADWIMNLVDQALLSQS